MKEKRSEHSRKSERQDESNTCANARDHSRASKNVRSHTTRRRAEYDANADLPRLVANDRRHDAKEPNGRKQQRDDAEARHQQGPESRLRERSSEDLIHRLRAPKRKVRIDIVAGGAKCW